MNDRRMAPWTDFARNNIFEGDVIVHPDQMRGTVVFCPEFTEPSDQWRVTYKGDLGLPARLVLQIGDRGRAVVEVRPATND